VIENSQLAAVPVPRARWRPGRVLFWLTAFIAPFPFIALLDATL